jgi:hypothetical protein
MRADPWLIAAALALSACGGRTAPSPPAPAGARAAEGLALADSLGDLLSESIRADARLESADSLYASGASFVADGHRRMGLPRYAGVEPGGQVAISSMVIGVTRAQAWAAVEYRWFSTQDNVVREAQATVIFAPLAGTAGNPWRIIHTHSSIAR